MGVIVVSIATLLIFLMVGYLVYLEWHPAVVLFWFTSGQVLAYCVYETLQEWLKSNR